MFVHTMCDHNQTQVGYLVTLNVGSQLIERYTICSSQTTQNKYHTFLKVNQLCTFAYVSFKNDFFNVSE